MAKRKLSRFEKIILIAFVNCVIVLVGFWLMDKKPNRDFYLPKGHEGWISIRYQVTDAAEIPMRDGVQQIGIPPSGYLETSNLLTVGWRRDRYFWVDGTDTLQIPGKVDLADGPGIYTHHHAYFAKSYEYLLGQLPAHTDTTMEDGTHIIMEADNKVDYTMGNKTLEYFYISKNAQSVLFNPPPHPNHEGIQSTADRIIKTNAQP
ncbi:MAG: hypothetical protein AAF587_26165 [Bacteroidota bacterium]